MVAFKNCAFAIIYDGVISIRKTLMLFINNIVFYSQLDYNKAGGVCYRNLIGHNPANQPNPSLYGG